ncbi:9734_t:CDS:2 [Diversispora eburnea]|uniref:9734_t:CDS:1 n=1 Tax=Diversispora eburnea TaxID=1213867 RepID=A0A9N9CS16_9GLOM|nr:9734_t:CDS:2 [Diversispora eburnea]
MIFLAVTYKAFIQSPLYHFGVSYDINLEMQIIIGGLGPERLPFLPDSPCNKILDTEVEEEPCGLKKWSQPKSHDMKTVTNLSRSDNVSSVVSELERDNEIDEVDTSQIVEQGLMQELSQNTPDIEINKSYIQNLDNLTSAQSLSYLFDKAVVKSQEEILRWYYYSLEFENRVKIPPTSKPKEDLLETKKTLSEKQNNPVHTHANFRNKTLEQYPNLYYEYRSKKNIDYYGVNAELPCPICKLNHKNEDGINGEYKDGSYYIKCEASGIGIIILASK